MLDQFIRFRYHTIFGMVVIDRTVSNTITSRLPLGDISTKYEILIEILVYDSLGAAYMDFIPVTVSMSKLCFFACFFYFLVIFVLRFCQLMFFISSGF